FPGRRDDQIPEFGGTNREWAVDRIIRHHGSHADATFEVQWTAGDRTWLPYEDVAHLKALSDYFEVIGVDGIDELRDAGDRDTSDDDPQVFIGYLAPHLCGSHKNRPCMRWNGQTPRTTTPLYPPCHNNRPTYTSHFPCHHSTRTIPPRPPKQSAYGCPSCQYPLTELRSGHHARRDKPPAPNAPNKKRPYQTQPSSWRKGRGERSHITKRDLEPVKHLIAEVVSDLQNLSFRTCPTPARTRPNFMSTTRKVKNIERQSTDLFLVRNPDKEGRGDECVVIHREQVKTYFEFDRSLRRKHEVALDTPAGYHLFREAHSREAKSKARFAYYEVDDSGNIVVVAEGPSPTREEVLGNDADLRSKEEATGGQTLNSVQMDTINALLWDTAERVKKQQRRAHQGYVDRRERRDSRRREAEPYGNPLPRDTHLPRISRSSRPNHRSRKSNANVNPHTRNSYAPEQPVAGPSTFVVDHAMTGDEGYEEDVDALGEDDDEVSPEHAASHEDAQGFAVGKLPGKSA
ncbi:hypothetical protein M404DRAFT_25454, partial [Pisolithus tinctorius Marx 270]